MATQTQIVAYKGRSYRLLWTGKTQYGARAKLAFLDGSKEFWVEADKVKQETGRVFLPPTKGSIGVGECEHCGRKRTLFAARDVTGDPGRVCSRCKKEAGYY